MKNRGIKEGILILIAIVLVLFLVFSGLRLTGFVSIEQGAEIQRGSFLNSILREITEFFNRPGGVVLSPGDECTKFVDLNIGSGSCTTYNPTTRSCSGGTKTAGKTLAWAGQNAVAGDVVCVRAGTYTETLTPQNSGTASQKIVFKAYPGEECKTYANMSKYDCGVVIDGSNVISGTWTQCSSQETCGNNPNWQSIYHITLSDSLSKGFPKDIIFEDEERLRYATGPDNLNPYFTWGNYYIAQSIGSNTVYDPTNLNHANGFWDNGYIKFRDISSSHVYRKISSFNSNTLNLNQAIGITPVNNGYILINHLSLLDQPGEFYVNYDTNPKMLYMISTDGQNPQPHTISIASRSEPINLYLKNYIRIEGLEIKKGYVDGIVYLSEYGDTTGGNIEIVNNYIHDNFGSSEGVGSGSGIYARGTVNNVTIENNEIFRNGGNGIWVWGNNIITSANNVHYNAIDAVTGGGRNWLIENNHFYDQCYTDGHQDGIDTDNDNNWTIRYNTIFDFTQLVYFDTDGPGVHDNINIYGNIFYLDKCGNGPESNAPAIFITNGNNLSIHSNTCGWLGQVGGIDGYKCVQVYGNVKNLTIRNNIAYDSYFDVGINNMNEVSSDYNLFYNNRPTMPIEGSHSITGQNPQFVNYSRHSQWDFHLLSNSPAINSGNLTGIPLPSPFVDIDGTTRPQPAGGSYDIGAYEYQSVDNGCDYVINAGQSINMYNGVVNPGETICVHSGIYTETLQPTRSGTAGNLITYKAFPGEECQGTAGEPKIAGSCAVIITNSAGNSINLNAKSFIRVEGFEIKDSFENGLYGGLLPTDSPNTNVEIINNYIHDNGLSHIGGVIDDGSGFETGCTNNLLVENNEFYNNGDGAVAPWCGNALGMINYTVRGNNIHHNGQDGIRVIAWPTYFIQNILIENNVMYDEFDSNEHQDGILFENVKHLIIRNNVISDFTQLIYTAGTSAGFYAEDVQIYGNIMYNSRYYSEWGGTTQCIYFDGMRMPGNTIKNISIHSNTCGWTGYAPIWIYGELNTIISDVRITSNIFYDKGPDVSGGTITGLYSDYNLYFQGPKPGFEGIHSITADPLLANYQGQSSTNFDFHLLPTSPAINSGNLNGISLPSPFVDIDGTTRPQPAGGSYDIGAYEYLGGESSCSDGIQNGNELGIDCGGSCEWECPVSHVIGIDVEINGTPGEDYAVEWAYHDRKVDDAKIIYIKDDAKIGLNANSLNHDGSPGIRYKIDRDEQGVTSYYSDNNLGFGPITPLYSAPFALSEKTFVETGAPVVGTTGNNGLPYPSDSTLCSGKPKYRGGGRTNYGILDSFNDEWHVLTFWDNQENIYDQRGDWDADSVLLVVNPKTPLISFKNLTASAQYYTTPAKTYFIPAIMNQTTYLTANVEIRLTNIMGGAIYYKIDNGATQTYVGAINSNSLSDGQHILEYWYNPSFHKIRIIVKNPPYPSAGEQHPHNFLWDSNKTRDIIKDRIANVSYYSSTFADIKDPYFSGYENTIFNGARIGLTGSQALANAFVAYINGMNYQNEDFARKGKKFLLDSIFMSNLIGQEDPINNGPAPYLHYYQNIGSGKEAMFNTLAYDLLIGEYKTSNGYVNGFTPIEDYRVRDSLAYYSKTTIQLVNERSRQCQNDVPSMECSPGELHIGASSEIGTAIISLTMPKYDSIYYGTSGAPPDSLTATHAWTPYPNYPNDWWDIATNEYPTLYGNPEQSTYSRIRAYIRYQNSSHTPQDCHCSYWGNVNPLYNGFTNIIHNSNLSGTGLDKYDLSRIDYKLNWYLDYMPCYGQWCIQFPEVNKNFYFANNAYQKIVNNIPSSQWYYPWMAVRSGHPVFAVSYFDYGIINCTDGKQDYYEEGIDCGGTCPNECIIEDECAGLPDGTACSSDGNVCTNDICSSGVCSHPFNANSCNDNNACTSGDICSLGVCSGAAITQCLDGDGCCPSGCTFVDDNDCQSCTTTALETWYNSPFTQQAGTFTAEYDVTPIATGLDLVLGLSNGAASAYTNLAAIVRFSDNGRIEVRNGGSYSYTNQIIYQQGIKYHIRMVVNVAAKTYSVYVTPQAGSEIILANNFAFRTEQSGVGQLNNFAIIEGYTTGSQVCNFHSSLQFDECTDSDGGFNIYLRGAVSGYLNGDFYSFMDYCMNATRLNEYTCDGVNWVENAADCPATHECNQGACLPRKKIGNFDKQKQNIVEVLRSPPVQTEHKNYVYELFNFIKRFFLG